MIRRVAVALALIAATVYWADCGFHVGVPAPTDPAWNTFFAGCFQGPVTEPPGSADLIVVLEAKPDDTLMVGGCLRLASPLGVPDNGSVAGEVQDDRLQARVTVMPNSGSPSSYTILVKRDPAGDVVATAVDLTNDSGAPYKSAANLQHCTMTCADLGISMPFLPGGGAQ